MYYHEVVLPMMYATFKALNPVLGPAAIGAESPNFTFLPTGKRADGRAWATFSVGIGDDQGGPASGSDGKEATP
jgi:hypothetical protein